MNNVICVVLCFILFPVSRADYDCLCSYLEELNVYANDDVNSTILGSMYEFDCKPTYAQKSTTGFMQPIQFEHQIGYVEKQTGFTVVQGCLGSIPSADIVPAVSTMTTTLLTTTTPLTKTATAEASTTPLTKTTTTPLATARTSSSTTTTTTETATTQMLTANTHTTSTIMPSTSVEPLKTSSARSSTEHLSSLSSTTSSTSTSTPTTHETSTLKTTTTPKPLTAIGCPEDWIRHHGACYLFVINRKLNHQDASNECLKQGSHLVFINSSSEQKFISGYLERLYDYTRSGRGWLWMGAMDDDKEGKFFWKNRLTNTDIPLGYTHWDSHEPDNGNGYHNEDCTMIRGDRHYRWHDYTCSFTLYYICERSAYFPEGGAPTIIG